MRKKCDSAVPHFRCSVKNKKRVTVCKATWNCEEVKNIPRVWILLFREAEAKKLSGRIWTFSSFASLFPVQGVWIPLGAAESNSAEMAEEVGGGGNMFAQQCKFTLKGCGSLKQPCAEWIAVWESEYISLPLTSDLFFSYLASFLLCQCFKPALEGPEGSAVSWRWGM